MTPDAAGAGEVSAGALADSVEAGDRVDVLDVRNRDEVDAWRIEGPGVRLTTVPYMEFVSTRATGDPASLVAEDRSYVVVCPAGDASAEIAAALSEAGIDAANLAGGMAAWAQVYRNDAVAVASVASTATRSLRYTRAQAAMPPARLAASTSASHSAAAISALASPSGQTTT